MALYTMTSRNDFARLNRLPNINQNLDQNQQYNAIGRNESNNGGDDNFFAKRGRSIENALGTTGASVVSAIDSAIENQNIEDRNKSYQDKLNSIAQKYNFKSFNDVWDAREAAEAAGDTATLAKIDNEITPELQAQAQANMDDANYHANKWKDYRENSYVGQKVNQDRGKFLGSAINTLSTATDVLGLTNGPVGNAIQGGIEGVADELEQNGLNNFSWERAGQNALTGAASGALTGAVNNAISGRLAQNGGNLFRGGNRLTKGLNNLGSSTAAGRIGSTLATGAARGAISGAVGGATGAGVSAAMNGQDVLGSALQGATQGAKQGAFAGSVMAAGNMALNKTPGVGRVLQESNQATDNWRNSGNNFNERLTNTLTSGDSAVGEWLQGNNRSSVLGKLRNIGGTLENVENLVDNTGRRVPFDIAKRLSGIDPRMLDENGNLKVMYHGTPNGGFDRPNDGTYFTENKKYADGYQNPVASSISNKNGVAKNPMTYEGYLDIKKPFTLTDENAKKIYLDEYIKGGNSQYYDPYTDYRKTIDGLDEVDWVEGENLRDWLQQNHPEYDGLFLDEGGNGGYGEAEYEWRGKSVVPFSGDQFINRNTQTPTTLGGWLKKAGGRIIDDMNNRGVGMSIKDVGGEGRIPLDESMRRINGARTGGTNASGQSANASAAQNTQLDNSAATEVFRALNKQPNNDILRTSKEYEYRQKANRALLDQYDTVDAPIARAIDQNAVVEEFAKMGFTKPQEVETISRKITGSGGTVSKLVRKMLNSAQPVNTMDGVEPGKSFDDFVNDQLALSGLKEDAAKATRKLIDGRMGSLDSRRKGTLTGLDDANSVFDVVQKLERDAANLRGKSGDNYVRTNPERGDQADAIERVAGLLRDRIFEGADAKSVVTPEVVADMKNWAPNNKQWADYVDENFATIKDGQGLRAFQKRSVEAQRMIEAGKRNYNTFGGSLSRAARRLGSGNPVVLLANAAEIAADTPAGKEARYKYYTKKADAEAAKNAKSANIESQAPEVPNDTAETPTEAASAAYNPATQLYNAIGRTEGEIQGEKAAGNYLTEAAQEVGTVNVDNRATSDPAMSVYNALNGGSTSTTGTTGTSGAAQSMTSGDYYTNLLSRALEMAMDNNDAAAYGALLGMLQEAQANNQTSATQEKLTDKQRQANAAAFALDELEQMEPDAAYNLSDIPVIGGIATIGGNGYEAAAKSLAQQVGYMLSGANVTKEEAENIGRAYVPQPRDNAEIRKQKLAKVRGIISEYQRTYSE